MALDEKELLKIKKEIESNKENVSRLQGEKKALMKRLKEEFDCKDLDEAKTKLSDLRETISTLNGKIETLSEEIEENYFENEEG